MPLPCGVYNETYNKDAALLRTKTHWGLTAGLIVIIILLPFGVSSPVLSWLTLVAITVLAALGLNITTGYCGQLSIGHTAFLAVGAFTYANLAKLGLSWPLAMLCAGCCSALTGTIFGLPSVRVKELYLALTTLAAQFIVVWVLVEYFGGDSGIVPPDPTIGSLVIKGRVDLYYFCWFFTLSGTYLVFNLGRTKIGRAYKAIRDHDLAAKAMGINIGFYKVSSFTVGCFVAGIAGALWVIWIGKADVAHFTVSESIWYLGMIVVGGTGSVAGTYFGVFLIRGLMELSTIFSGWFIGVLSGLVPYRISGAIPTVVVATVIILFIILEPRGLNDRWLKVKESYRLWPWSHW